MTATKLPSGSYRCQVTINGHRRSVTRKTAAEARRAATALLVQEEGRQADKLQGKTLKSACEDFLDLRRPVLSPSTIRGYRQIIENRFQSIMEIPLSALTDRMIQEAVNLDLSHLSPKTVKNSFGFLSSVLYEAVGRRPSIRLPQVVQIDKPFLEPEDIGKFLDVVHGADHEIAFLLALHGLRVSEILALTKESISNGIIHIRGAAVLNEDNQLTQKPTNKNATSRRDVPVVIPRLQDLIDAAAPGLLETAQSRRLSNSLKGFCLRNNLPPLTMHCLRHSFASLCYHLRLSEMETMRLGGWSNPATMRKIYTHLSEKDADCAAAKLKGFFAS